MRWQRTTFCWLLVFLPALSFAQNKEEYKWWDPATNAFPVIEGRGWSMETAGSYDRFPARAEKTVNPNVWNISHSSAGEYIKFRSGAGSITVRYVVKGSLSMSHMPTTGVSGVDLYCIDPEGRWLWAPGDRSYGDTIEYRFSHLSAGKLFAGRDLEYRLYLPLYTAVTWMQIGVPVNASLTPIPLSRERPIVVYGTSIVQGACASRPGMAWTNILQERMDRPLINLGFSGSGKLEPAIIDLMGEIDAKLYILDCIPNMTEAAGFSPAELERRIIAAVRQLKAKRPAVPVLLAGHSGGVENGIMDTTKNNDYAGANEVLGKAFSKLKADGTEGIYLLTSRDIGFTIYSTVDGLHPGDVGMMEYADAYEKIIRKIFTLKPYLKKK